MPEESTTADPVELTRQSIEAANRGDLRALFEASPLGSQSTMQERSAFTVIWEQSMISRVVASRDIDEARAAAERLAEQRG
jgi:hypothetical protein